MQYRSLGRTGIKVSPYCLGAMMFGSDRQPDHDDSVRIIHKGPDFGINFIDTADRYMAASPRRSSARRSRGGATASCSPPRCMARWATIRTCRANSRRWITRAVEASLRRLGTDHIDLYQMHRPAPDTDIEETLSVLTD